MTPFSILLTPGWSWRAAVALLATASAATVISWWLLVPAASGVAVGVAVSAAVVAVVASAASLWRAGRGVLSFDGRAWWLTRRPGEEPIAGAARVAIDLGSFLLLRFEPLHRSGMAWLPVDSNTARSDWHALRAAVYSARLDAGSAAGGAPFT